MPAGCTFVAGQTGMGKTLWLRAHLATLPRFIVYDHMAELGDAAGARVVFKLRDALDHVQANGTGFLRLVYQEIPSPRTFDFFCRLALLAGDLVLIVDELDQFAGSVRPLPSTPFLNVIHRGRHRGIGVVGASRRAAEVSRTFTSQCRRFVVFRTTEPNDLGYLRSIVGPPVMGARSLEPLTYLDFDLHTMAQRRLDIPRGPG